MQHAYASFNKALSELFKAIAPDLEVGFDHPTGENGEALSLPPSCFRVYWLTQGENLGSDYESATVQVDIFIANNDREKAMRLASLINTGLHFRDGVGFGRLPRYDYSNPIAPVLLSQMEVEPWESGWQTIPDPRSGTVHLARTLLLSYRV